MRKLLIALLCLSILCIPVSALEAPAPGGDALYLMPDTKAPFGQALMNLVQKILPSLEPELLQALGICAAIVGASMVVSLLTLDGNRVSGAASLTAAAAVSVAFFSGAKSLIVLAGDTVTELCEYSKLFLPVITAALAAQGRPTTSASLYAGTAVFNTVLGNFLGSTVIPLLYLFLPVSVCACISGEKMLKNLKKEMKTFITWSLKTILTVFTAYLSITGVVSGTTDAAALKATKTAISAFVPVVGGVLSDASEAVLVSAGLVKNSVGIYGIYAMLAIFLKPFLRIAVHYLLLKFSSFFTAVFGSEEIASLCEDFTSALGMLLGLTGAMCLLQLISCICYLRGSGL